MGRNELDCDCDVIHQEKVEKAKQQMLDEEKLLLIADFYKALSDSTRIKIVNLLENNELCVCDISVILNMTKSAVSHQLKNLREMNLIKSRKIGKEVWYSLADNHVKEVFDVSLEHIMETEND
ncbi:MAG: winged helix-turn-helix transcriptional regulator [Clostridia bacterium]|nr:winged helix-turn-helix transcriptional regulator [Clostridia bacterium]